MKRHRYSVAVALIVAAAASALSLLVGCGGTHSDPTANVTGLLIDDQTLAPLAGAMIRIGAKTVTAASDGSFAIEGAPIGSGQQLIIAASGYPNYTSSVNVQAGQNSVGSLYIPRTIPQGTGAISGVVTVSGVRTGNLNVTAAGITGVTKSDDANRGSFTLYGVLAGDAINVTATDGSETGTTTVRVVPGQTTSNVQVGLTLTPPSPF